MDQTAGSTRRRRNYGLVHNPQKAVYHLLVSQAWLAQAPATWNAFTKDEEPIFLFRGPGIWDVPLVSLRGRTSLPPPGDSRDGCRKRASIKCSFAYIVLLRLFLALNSSFSPARRVVVLHPKHWHFFMHGYYSTKMPFVVLWKGSKFLESCRSKSNSGAYYSVFVRRPTERAAHLSSESWRRPCPVRFHLIVLGGPLSSMDRVLWCPSMENLRPAFAVALSS